MIRRGSIAVCTVGVLVAAWLSSVPTACAAQRLANPDFEAAPFPAGWTGGSGLVSTAGFNGSATAARLPYNTWAFLGQTIGPPGTNFTADVSLQVAGTNEAQAFRMVLDTAGGPAVEVRTGRGGALQVNAGGAWLGVERTSDGAAFAVPPNRTVRLRVIGRRFGAGDAAWDLAWSDPGSTVLVHAATGLVAFEIGRAHV